MVEETEVQAEIIRTKRILGMTVARDESTGEDDVTVLGLETDDGRAIAIRIASDAALESVTALIAGLASAAQGSSSLRVAIPASAWQIERGPGGAVLHAYFVNSNGARLSFGLEREHVRPLAERLLMLAEEQDAQLPVPTVPPSQARN